MTDSAFDCVVVGAGHAGLAAAAAAARAGIGVLLVDAGEGRAGAADGEARLSHEVPLPAGVVMRHQTTAWSVFGADTVALATSEGAERVRARVVVIATGAHDRSVAFPGWTVPGVVTASAAGELLRDPAVTTRRVLLAGSGPELLALARVFVGRGAHVAAVCEASAMRGLWRHGARMLPHLDVARRAYRDWRSLDEARVPVMTSHVIRRALGAAQVAAVIVGRCDTDWRPIAGGEQRLDVDTIVLAYGRVPSTELARLAGCAHRFAPAADAWLPVRTRELESSVPGVFVIGGAAGTMDTAAALEEGRLAGLAVANRLGRGVGRAGARERARVRGRLLHHAGLRRAVERVYPIGPGLHALADDETLLCPCEAVAVRAALAVIRDGAVDVNDVKAETRVGMGHCRGRLCGASLAHLIARETRRPVEEAGAWSPRPPVRPVPLGILAAGDGGHRRG